MDIEMISHDLSLLYAKSELKKQTESKPEAVTLKSLLDDYFTAYGFFSKQDSDYISSLIQQGATLAKSAHT